MAFTRKRIVTVSVRIVQSSKSKGGNMKEKNEIPEGLREKVIRTIDEYNFEYNCFKHLEQAICMEYGILSLEKDSENLSLSENLRKFGANSYIDIMNTLAYCHIDMFLDILLWLHRVALFSYQYLDRPDIFTSKINALFNEFKLGYRLENNAVQGEDVKDYE